MSNSGNQIAQAVQLLRRGELVAFPTETVYGLGADALNLAALTKLYETKGRPTSHPVIVHIGEIGQLSEFATEVPAIALKLAEAFWPGPLTMILKKQPSVPLSVTGGQDTVGLRMPNHPIALELLSRFKGGVAAPSANRFGRISPTTAEDVVEEFGDRVALVLDGGPCEVGIESTIVDLTQDEPLILRPGMIGRKDLAEAAGQVILARQCRVKQALEDATITRAPGDLPSHYAPDTPLLLLPGDALQAEYEAQLKNGSRLAVISFSSAPNGSPAEGEHKGTVDALTEAQLVDWIVADRDPALYARKLYANLRYLDHLKCDRIIVERPPISPEWQGIEDRLTRASH